MGGNSINDEMINEVMENKRFPDAVFDRHIFNQCLLPRLTYVMKNFIQRIQN